MKEKQGSGTHLRDPCTCNVGNALCPACLVWSVSHGVSYGSKRGGSHAGNPVLENGRLTYTKYSKRVVRAVQHLWASGMVLDAIALRMGVPYGSIRRIVHMELVDDNTP